MVSQGSGVNSRASRAALLEERISANSAQEVDLVAWIFEHLRVPKGSKVLELCSGTGAQTVPLLRQVGDSGFVAALDISQEALDTIEQKSGSSPNLALIRSDLDDTTMSLLRTGLGAPCFDLIFCAYGLYYSANGSALLDSLLPWLCPNGRIAVVGPYGPNNRPLFELLTRAGVHLAPEVLFSSRDFVWEQVIPWGSEHFKWISIHTLVNRVRWASAERVLRYWENSTFYEPQRLGAVKELLSDHFTKEREFINEKWVMMAEMVNARA